MLRRSVAVIVALQRSSLGHHSPPDVGQFVDQPVELHPRQQHGLRRAGAGRIELDDRVATANRSRSSCTLTQPLRSLPIVASSPRCIGSFGPQPRHQSGHSAPFAALAGRAPVGSSVVAMLAPFGSGLGQQRPQLLHQLPDLRQREFRPGSADPAGHVHHDPRNLAIGPDQVVTRPIRTPRRHQPSATRPGDAAAMCDITGGTKCPHRSGAHQSGCIGGLSRPAWRTHSRPPPTVTPVRLPQRHEGRRTQRRKFPGRLRRPARRSPVAGGIGLGGRLLAAGIGSIARRASARTRTRDVDDESQASHLHR